MPMKWRIGRVSVTKIVELEVTGGSRFLLPQATRESILPIDWLRPDFADAAGRLKMSVHALVVETPRRRIVVDTCLGNDKEGRRVPGWNRLQTRFLADLAAAGCARETIDTVVCTHLHVDHVGWNTMLVDGPGAAKTWVPTFPRARYLFGRVEYEHWTQHREHNDMIAVFADSVAPVFDAGLVDLVETRHRVCDEVSLVPTPVTSASKSSPRARPRSSPATSCTTPARSRGRTGRRPPIPTHRSPGVPVSSS
jgi:hypothetical protein